MADKVVLYYFNGRGKMESIRWLLTVAEVEFDEVHLRTREDYEKLLRDGDLMFQQVPLVEMDGMKLIQSKAILHYIAGKYDMLGKDLKERVMIEMYSEGLIDLMEMMMKLIFMGNTTAEKENILNKAKNRYLPVFEKVLIDTVHLVGGKVSLADVLLTECTLMLEELFVGILGDFRNIKSFQGRMTMIPAINRFLLPGSKRRPPPDEVYKNTVMEVLQFRLP